MAEKRAVARDMNEEAVRKFIELVKNPNNVFRVVGKNDDGKYIFCLQESTCEEMLEHINEKDRAKLCKEHISNIMNEVNTWDQIAEADTV